MPIILAATLAAVGVSLTAAKGPWWAVLIEVCALAFYSILPVHDYLHDRRHPPRREAP